MKKSILILIAVSSLFIGDNVQAQDARFSLFNTTPILLNPGLIGMGNGFSRANINYRSQWSSIPNAYSTAAASADFPLFAKNIQLKKGYFGTGFGFMTDKAGDAKWGTNQINLGLSTVIFVGENSKISLGTTGSYTQRSVSPENLLWDTQYNGFEYDSSLPNYENFASVSASKLDIAAGMAFRHYTGSKAVTNNDQKLFELGASVYNILQPNYEFLLASGGQTSMRFTGHGRYLTSIKGSKFVIGGTFLYLMQNAFQELTFGPEFRFLLAPDTKYTGYIRNSYVGMQLLYRNQDAVIPAFFFKFSNFKITGAYDYNISDLNSASNGMGGFEISIQFNDFEGTLFKQGTKHVVMKGAAGIL